MSIAIRVTRFEANLLQITRCVVGAAPPRSCASMLVTGNERPEGLTAGCIKLLKQMLSRGVVMQLLRLGGWRRRSWMSNKGEVVERAWKLDPSRWGLTYSDQSVEFLLWLTATPFGVDRQWTASRPLTIGDRLLLLLACDSLQEFPAVRRYTEMFGQSELNRLAWPEHFPLDDRLDFADWTTGPGAQVLEMLEDHLVKRWLTSAEHRQGLASIQLNRSYAQLQRHVLTRFAGACRRAERLELARPLLRTVASLAASRPRLDQWRQEIDFTGQPVSVRYQTRRESLSMLDLLAVFEQWTAWARSIGFVDEQYETAQLWLKIWEQWRGDDALAAAQALQREASPLSVGGDANHSPLEAPP